MRIRHVQTVNWPVWLHVLEYSVFETEDLTVLEEGALLLVQAGIESAPDAAELLGCSDRYGDELLRRLASGHSQAALRIDENGSLHTTPNTARCIEERTKRSLTSKRLTLLRDGIFDTWLSFGDSVFDIVPRPSDSKDPHTWLDIDTSPVCIDESVKTYAISLAPEPEVVSCSMAIEGARAWAKLWLACYQPAEGPGGRFLLFNSEGEDIPLPDLSSAFEADLTRGQIKLYHQDDSVETAALFWETLAGRLRYGAKTDEILACAEALDDTNASIAQINVGEPQHEKTVVDSDSVEEISALRFQKEALEARVVELIKERDAIPRTEHIESRQHPAILFSAIRAANVVLILICPWIKMRVLKPLLPELDRAMDRGCRIYIGYGMPRNPMHPENTDEEALRELRKRASTGMLTLSHLKTHEKVIIQDDAIFVNSSFNFLSYTGGDGRRESGTITRRGVRHIRDKFLAAFSGG
jgi:hypothetical protein